MQPRKVRHVPDVSRAVAEFGQGLHVLSAQVEQSVTDLKRASTSKQKPGSASDQKHLPHVQLECETAICMCNNSCGLSCPGAQTQLCLQELSERAKATGQAVALMHDTTSSTTRLSVCPLYQHTYVLCPSCQHHCAACNAGAGGMLFRDVSRQPKTNHWS